MKKQKTPQRDSKPEGKTTDMKESSPSSTAADAQKPTADYSHHHHPVAMVASTGPPPVKRDSSNTNIDQTASLQVKTPSKSAALSPSCAANDPNKSAGQQQKAKRPRSRIAANFGGMK